MNFQGRYVNIHICIHKNSISEKKHDEILNISLIFLRFLRISPFK